MHDAGNVDTRNGYLKCYCLEFNPMRKEMIRSLYHTDYLKKDATNYKTPKIKNGDETGIPKGGSDK